MKINPHKSATTTPATRGYIQASTKTAVARSAEPGVSMTTIYKVEARRAHPRRHAHSPQPGCKRPPAARGDYPRTAGRFVLVLG